MSIAALNPIRFARSCAVSGALCVASALSFAPSNASAQCIEFSKGLVPTDLPDSARAVAVFDAGDGATVYAATNSGMLEAYSAANGWTQVSTTPAAATCMASSGAELLIGTSTGAVHAWDGSTWRPLPGLNGGSIDELISLHGRVYARGNFTLVNGASPGRMAYWDGTQWNAFAFAGSISVRDMCVHGTSLGVYGSSNLASTGNSVAFFDGTSWTAPSVAAPMAGGSTCGSNGTDFYIIVEGFSFQNLSVWRWNGSSWQSAASIPFSVMLGTATYNGKMLAFGDNFHGNGSSGFVITYTGNTISQTITPVWLPSLGGAVYATAELAGELHVVGRFTESGQIQSNWAMRRNGDTWSASGEGNYGVVRALTEFDGDLIFAGQFSSLNGQTPPPVALGNIGRLDESGVNALGSGISGGTVHALGTFGSQLIAGGAFSAAGGSAVRNIASWDGSNWSSLGIGGNEGVHGGTSPIVRALLGAGPTLYVGGTFANAGAQAAVGNIAAWNGTTWSRLQNGVDGTIRAMAMFDGDLIVVGDFTHADGNPAAGVARWNGSAWTALGTGNQFRALAVHDNQLFAGSRDLNLGVYRWTGSTWALDSTPSQFGVVTSLISHDGQLLATDDGGYVWARLGADKWLNVGRPVYGTSNQNCGTCPFGGLKASCEWAGAAYVAGADFLILGESLRHERADITRIDVGGTGPEITQQPVDTTVNLGYHFELTVAVNGDSEPVAYQWYHENTLIDGATNATLLIDPASLDDAGDYFVRITSLCGVTDSDVVTVTVATACPEDINEDFVIDLTDLSRLLASFGLCSGSPGYDADADVNGTNCVDLVDLSGLLAHFGSPCP